MGLAVQPPIPFPVVGLSMVSKLWCPVEERDQGQTWAEVHIETYEHTHSFRPQQASTVTMRGGGAGEGECEPNSGTESVRRPGETGSEWWQDIWQGVELEGRAGQIETGFDICTLGSVTSVQWLSCVQLFMTPWIAARQASLSITNSRSSLKLMSIELVMPFSHLIFCRPLLLLPLIPPSIRVFSNESTLCMRWPKYWSFSFSISPSKEHPGPISFRMDWLDLLAVQGTFKSLLQHHSSKASILQCLAFFTVQLPYPYMTTGKTTWPASWETYMQVRKQ